ncbi:hypothetical protein PTKIN_Ptkin13bG0273400 [Pterospermum kingtungense]
MEVKEAERIVIAKPVASRPTCSSFNSFSDLVAGAVDASPPNASPETAVPAIRPKTAELSGTGVSSSSDKVLKPDVKPTVVFKPQAKLVSKTTVSLLANMGNFNTSNQLILQLTETPPGQHANQEKKNFRTQVSPNLHQAAPSHPETDQTTKVTSQNMEEDPRVLPAAANTDRPSYDGYNWRKYGQKHVKGSEYPRSYYKCTHPNCPVKKKVERSFDGQITEIVYRGEHNHSKPQPPKRNSPGTQGLGFASDATDQDTNNSLLSNNNPNERNEGSEVRAEDQNEVGVSAPPSYHGKALLPYEHLTSGAVNAGATSENSIGLTGECDQEGSKEGKDDEPRSKRRKSENQASEVGTSGECVQEPRVVVQSSPDSEIMGDGFRWRKYGQKVVKGNAFPRSYYRCTNLKCNVRKHVERASDVPRTFITTYEGKHNHEMPLRNTNPVASDPDSNSPASKDKR